MSYTWLVALALLSPDPTPAGPDAAEAAEVAAAERVLRDSGVASDGPSLVAYVRRQTPTPEERARLAALVARLGNEAFAERERAVRGLREAGRMALPLLRRAAESPDPEVSRRARSLVRAAEATPYRERMTAAARLLAVRRSSGAAEVLLAFLPFADEEEVEEAAREALGVVGFPPGKGVPLDAVTAAADDKEPSRRAAAAYVLGRADPGARGPLGRLLRDPEPRVRLQAAEALVRAGDRAGVPALVALLGDAPPAVAWRAEDLLFTLAGERAPGVSLGAADAKARGKSRAAWEGWWKEHGASADLAVLRAAEAPLGIVVTCEWEIAGRCPGYVRALGRDGKERWVVQGEGLDSPYDVQLLPGGRVLAAEFWTQRVTERDRRGKVLWERQLDDHPVTCKRLPGGNTFIATQKEVMEVAPDGRKVFSHLAAGGQRLYCAERLRNGHVLYITADPRVVEVDATGAAVREFTPQGMGRGGSDCSSVEKLANGHYLIALSGAGIVLETDGAGKVFWRQDVPSAVWATRLRNGHTLVANVNGKEVVELDRDGKVLRRDKVPHRPFRAKAY
jgi:HEAT repeat protein